MTAPRRIVLFAASAALALAACSSGASPTATPAAPTASPPAPATAASASPVPSPAVVSPGAAGASATGSAQGAAGVRTVAAAEAVGMLEGRTIVDVRTPEEFAQGHLAGAVNISVEAPDFDARIAELDPAAPYLLYCRSGRRSAIAADRMAAAGFTDVVDAGGMADLVAAGATTQ